MFDVEKARKIVDEQLESEGIKSIIKHEVEEVVWRVVRTAVRGSLQKEEITKYAKDRVKEIETEPEEIAKDVAERKISEWKMRDAIDEIKDKVLRAVPEHDRLGELIQEAWEDRKEEIEEQMSKRIDDFLKKETSDLVRREVSAAFDEIRDLKEEISALRPLKYKVERLEERLKESELATP